MDKTDNVLSMFSHTKVHTLSIYVYTMYIVHVYVHVRVVVCMCKANTFSAYVYM